MRQTRNSVRDAPASAARGHRDNVAPARRLLKKDFHSSAPPLLSLPEGERIKEGSRLFMRGVKSGYHQKTPFVYFLNTLLVSRSLGDEYSLVVVRVAERDLQRSQEGVKPRVLDWQHVRVLA
jgi:hypothetical protein